MSKRSTHTDSRRHAEIKRVLYVQLFRHNINPIEIGFHCPTRHSSWLLALVQRFCDFGDAMSTLLTYLLAVYVQVCLSLMYVLTAILALN